jgi:hypothetical protein
MLLEARYIHPSVGTVGTAPFFTRIEYPKTNTGPVRIDLNQFLKIEEPSNSLALERRIRTLATLADGWLDGEGKALPTGSIDWLIQNFARLDFKVRPGLSPTLEGNIAIEWSNGPWEASADIDLQERTARWHALNVDNPNQENEELIQLNSESGWARLQNLANELSSLNERI